MYSFQTGIRNSTELVLLSSVSGNWLLQRKYKYTYRQIEYWSCRNSTVQIHTETNTTTERRCTILLMFFYGASSKALYLVLLSAGSSPWIWFRVSVQNFRKQFTGCCLLVVCSPACVYGSLLCRLYYSSTVDKTLYFSSICIHSFHRF